MSHGLGSVVFRTRDGSRSDPDTLGSDPVKEERVGKYERYLKHDPRALPSDLGTQVENQNEPQIPFRI